MHPCIRFLRRTPRVPLLLLTLVLVVVPTLGIAGVAARPNYAKEVPGIPAFQRVWERTDQPVISGVAARTWMWGPQANTTLLDEDYAESPGGTLHYSITIPYFGDGVQEVAAEMSNQLSDLVQLNSEILCSFGECGYDEETPTVFWIGLIQADDTIVVEFDVQLLPATEEPPPQLDNCAEYSDVNAETDEACVTTQIIMT